MKFVAGLATKCTVKENFWDLRSLDIDETDLDTGRKWDLTDSLAQAEVLRTLARDEPQVIGRIPPCTLFSQHTVLG